MPSRKPTRSTDGRLSANRSKKPPAPKSRYQKLLDGEIGVEDLDDDEVMMGRCKDKNGKFAGRPPAAFPRAIHDSLHREFQRRMKGKWQQIADIGPSVLMEIATNHRASADARVKAAIYLTERTQGKIPDKIEQTLELKGFEEDLADILVDVPVDEIAAKRESKKAV